MKISLIKTASVIALISFAAYWVLIPLLTLPHVPYKKKLAENFKLPVKALVFNWRFFARPSIFNQRMYLVSRTTNTSGPDTVELIEPIVLEKQNKAPFNQHANILDHFIHYYAADVHRSAIKQRSKLESIYPSEEDSFYNRQIPALIAADKNAKPALKALDRYCRSVLQKKYPDNNAIEYKYIITALLTPSFGDPSRQEAKKETVVYDPGFRKY